MQPPTLYQAVHGRRAFLGWSRAELLDVLTDGEGMTATERARLSSVLRQRDRPRADDLDVLAGALGLRTLEGLGWPDLYAGEPLGDRADLWRRVHFRRVVRGGPAMGQLARVVFPDVTPETARANLTRLLAQRRADGKPYTEVEGARARLARALKVRIEVLDEGAPWLALCRESRR